MTTTEKMPPRRDLEVGLGQAKLIDQSLSRGVAACHKRVA